MTTGADGGEGAMPLGDPLTTRWTPMQRSLCTMVARGRARDDGVVGGSNGR
jgi:hypothetical protein